MNTDFQYFQSILFTNRRCLEYVTDKSKSSESIVNYMLARLQKMFKYSNLPDSIPRQYLENYLLVNGSCIIARDKKNPSDDSIYAFVGAAGGEPDIYYRPTRYMVANPSLQFSAEYYISNTDPNHEPDAILVRNDTMWQGLYPMMARYASLISENLLTVRTADVMLRVLALITAPDDKSKAAADIYLKNITDGKLASIAENRFLDGIRMQNPPSNNGSYLTQFIELHQYLVGSFYNEIGLNANYNMKREALSESETGLNDDSLMPLCEDMLRCRREDMERVNNMFGTSIQVDFDSSWLRSTIENLLSLRSSASEASSQLVNPAPLEEGMESVGLEEASQLGDSMEDAGGIEDAESEKESGMEGENDGEDSGADDSGSTSEEGTEESGTEEGDSGSDEYDENKKDSEGDRDVESGSEGNSSEDDVDGRIEVDGVKVEVTVDFMNPPEDNEEEPSQLEESTNESNDESTDESNDESTNESTDESGEEEKEDGNSED